RDTLVVTHPDVGAQLIPFLKTWALIPCSILFIRALLALRARCTFRSTYTWITLAFLAFFTLYVLVLGKLPPTAELPLPDILRGPGLMIQYWTISLFYVVSDLWTIIMLSMLFWTYVGELLSLDQAKRFFPYYSLDPCGILIGPVVTVALYLANGSWEGQLELLLGLVCALGLLQIQLFRKLCQHSDQEPALSKKKKGMAWTDMIDMARNPFLGSLALTVFLFEFTDNLFDVLWKGTLGSYVESSQQFSTYLANTTSAAGILCTGVALVFSKKILERYSWFQAAVTIPLLLALLTAAFSAAYFSPKLAAQVGALWGQSALGVAVFIGAVHSCLMAVAKQTLFDNTRDLAFQVCRTDERAAARGFADAFATRLGKSTSSLAHQGFMMAG
ncbi:MAG: hypothetical protein KDK78_08750, partial [Chlamydiia bacterium]|nr:hypothetical protein [Chlamydiia bacterium]